MDLWIFTLSHRKDPQQIHHCPDKTQLAILFCLKFKAKPCFPQDKDLRSALGKLGKRARPKDCYCYLVIIACLLHCLLKRERVSSSCWAGDILDIYFASPLQP
jgi:hypothetical protein